MAIDWDQVRRQIQALLECEDEQPIVVLCRGCGVKLRLRFTVSRYLSSQRIRCPRCQAEAGCLDFPLP